MIKPLAFWAATGAAVKQATGIECVFPLAAVTAPLRIDAYVPDAALFSALPWFLSAGLIVLVVLLAFLCVRRGQMMAMETAARERSEQAAYEAILDTGKVKGELEVALEKAQNFASASEAANHAKSDFLTSVSHEIRTPLNGILGLAALLAKGDLTPDQRALVEDLNQCCEALLDIVDDLLGHAVDKIGAEEGPDATFQTTLPDPAAEESGDQVEEIIWKRRPRVLVVEDNEINQKVAVRLLENAGCGVELAPDGFAAVESFRRRGRDLDLVFMDIQLPRVSGIEAAGKIRQLERAEHPEDYEAAAATPIIAMSAHVTPDNIKDFLAAGMDDILRKPFKEKQLLTVLTERIGHLAAEIRRGRPESDEANPTGEEDTSNQEPTSRAPVFDRELALEHMDGDEPFLASLAKEFAERARNAILDLRRLLAERNAKELERSFHSLKGGGNTMGAIRFSQTARDGEMLLKDRKDPIDAAATELIAQTIDAIEREAAVMEEAFQREFPATNAQT